MGNLSQVLLKLQNVTFKNVNKQLLFCRYIKAAIMDPANFNVDAKAMEHLEKRIAPAEYKIIDGNMLKVCNIDIGFYRRFNIFLIILNNFRVV